MSRKIIIGVIDKFMTPVDALAEILADRRCQYQYGEFAIRDILSEVCKNDWAYQLKTGMRLAYAIINSVIAMPKYSELVESKEYLEYLLLDADIEEDIIKQVMFVNDVLDRMSIPYHFYTYEENYGEAMIKVRRDGGVI